MTPDDLKAARDYVRARARQACGGTKGRGKLDPFYVTVTQGRDSRPNWKHYSSCGDQLHWLAVEMGVPIASDWINRDAPGIGKHWEFMNGRDNIGRLQHPGPAFPTPVGYLPEAGDYLLCWHDAGNDVHVRVAGNTTNGLLETFDYGAGGMSDSEFPGATCNHVNVSTIGGKLLLASPTTHATKPVQKIIPLPVLLALCVNLPSMTGEEIDALEKERIMNEHTDTERLPLSGKIPERDILIEIFDRVTLLSDEINDPDGVLSVSLRGMRDEADVRHQEMKDLMNRVLDEILNVRSRVDSLEDQREERVTVN